MSTGSTEPTKTIWIRLFDYALQQTPITLVLLLILGAMGYMGNYIVTTAIPAHLKQIQEGYDRQSATYERVQTEDRKSHEKEMEKITLSFDKSVEAMTKAINEIKR